MMNTKVRSALRKAAVVGAILFAGLLALMARLQWATLTQPKPRDLPEHAIRAPAPLVPLSLSRRGDWVGCEVEGQTNRCIVTDLRGKVEYSGLFLPYKGAGPIPAARLQFRSTQVENGPLVWGMLNAGDKSVRIIWLKDGTPLIPVEGYEELRPWVTRMLQLEQGPKPAAR